MVLASSAAELTKVQTQFKNAGLLPLTLHAWRQADDKLSYCGVWHKTATGTSDTASFQNGLSEANLPDVVAQQAGSPDRPGCEQSTSATQHQGACRHRPASGGSRPQGEAG